MMQGIYPILLTNVLHRIENDSCGIVLIWSSRRLSSKVEEYAKIITSNTLADEGYRN